MTDTLASSNGESHPPAAPSATDCDGATDSLPGGVSLRGAALESLDEVMSLGGYGGAGGNTPSVSAPESSSSAPSSSVLLNLSPPSVAAAVNTSAQTGADATDVSAGQQAKAPELRDATADGVASDVTSAPASLSAAADDAATSVLSAPTIIAPAPPSAPLPPWLMGITERGGFIAFEPVAAVMPTGSLVTLPPSSSSASSTSFAVAAGGGGGGGGSKGSKAAASDTLASSAPPSSATSATASKRKRASTASGGRSRGRVLPPPRWGLHSYTPVPGTTVYNARRHDAIYGAAAHDTEEEGLDSGSGAVGGAVGCGNGTSSSSGLPSHAFANEVNGTAAAAHSSASLVSPPSSSPASMVAAATAAPSAAPSDPVDMLMCAHCTARVGEGCFCPVCHAIYESDDSNMVSCDECEAWVHAACDGLTPADLLLIEDEEHPWWSARYACPLCRHRLMVEVLDALRAEDRAGHFQLPVTPEVAPGYHNVIRAPMDLWTMAHALDGGKVRRGRRSDRAVAGAVAAVLLQSPLSDVSLLIICIALHPSHPPPTRSTTPLAARVSKPFAPTLSSSCATR